MALEDIVLARRSIIRGVIMRCLEIAERFTEGDASKVKVSSGPDAAGIDAGKHRLAIRKSFVSGQNVGFTILTQQAEEGDGALYVFFNGKNIRLQFITEEVPMLLWETPVLSDDSSENGTNGLSETPFWENEFEQALKDHMPLLTEYIVTNGSMRTDGTSTTGVNKTLEALDRALVSGIEEADVDLEVEGLSGVGGIKNVVITSVSEGAGQYFGVSLGDGLSDIAKRFKNRVRVVPDSKNRFHSFAASLFAEAERQRYKTHRDADGNTAVDIYTGSKVELGEKFDYSDLLEAIYEGEKGSVAMTASEIIERAKSAHYENRDLYEEERGRQQAKQECEEEKLRIKQVAKDLIEGDELNLKIRETKALMKKKDATEEEVNEAIAQLEKLISSFKQEKSAVEEDQQVESDLEPEAEVDSKPERPTPKPGPPPGKGKGKKPIK